MLNMENRNKEEASYRDTGEELAMELFGLLTRRKMICS
jgi:hypothetical protein